MKKFREEEECHKGTAANWNDGTSHGWLGQVFGNFPINIQPRHKSNGFKYILITALNVNLTFSDQSPWRRFINRDSKWEKKLAMVKESKSLNKQCKTLRKKIDHCPNVRWQKLMMWLVRWQQTPSTGVLETRVREISTSFALGKTKTWSKIWHVELSNYILFRLVTATWRRYWMAGMLAVKSGSGMFKFHRVINVVTREY